MTRLISSAEPAVTVEARPAAAPDVERPAPQTAVVQALRQELAALQREVVVLRTQHQRDLATTRGLGEALGALRRGAMALRAENEDLRRRLAGRPLRSR